jgi:hypothetical protein
VAWPSDLRSLQQRFLALISADEGVPEALARMSATPADLGDLVVGDTRLDGVGRVTVYADMYFERLLGVLREDFPKLESALGEDPFRELVGAFLAEVPPANYSLRHLGAPLPDFVAARAALADRPWLGDLARLEWARADVFDGPDCQVLDLDGLRAVPADRYADLPLRLVPTQRQVPVAFAVEQTWRQIEAGEPAPPPRPGAGHLLVWRKHTEVLHRRLDPLEAVLLTALVEGSIFGLLCERLGLDRTVEEAAPLAFSFLAAWAEQGLLARPANELK